jgi:hypothetical protein
MLQIPSPAPGTLLSLIVILGVVTCWDCIRLVTGTFVPPHPTSSADLHSSHPNCSGWWLDRLSRRALSLSSASGRAPSIRSPSLRHRGQLRISAVTLDRRFTSKPASADNLRRTRGSHCTAFRAAFHIRQLVDAIVRQRLLPPGQVRITSLWHAAGRAFASTCFGTRLMQDSSSGPDRELP